MKIKGIINRILTALAGLIRFESTLNLNPISDLNKLDGTWISTGGDPAFILDGRFFGGWNIITWDSVSSHNIPVKLYWDEGAGFSEDKSMNLVWITSGASKYKSTFYIQQSVKRLRLDPGEQEVKFKLENIKIKNTTKYYILVEYIVKILKQRGFNIRTLRTLINKAITVYKYDGLKGLSQKVKELQGGTFDNRNSYEIWLSRNQVTENVIQEAERNMRIFEYKPLISIILPVYNVDEIWLRKCIDSVVDQIYSNWELCISDDASTEPHIKKVLTEYAEKDERIRVVFRKRNGHISENSNSAIEIAIGEYIALLDHDDELAIDALYENVLLLNTNRDADVIYSDEDKISIEGERFSPFFKPDWAPDLLMSQMYICHLTLYRKALVDQLGGFRTGYEGSQDFDLMLRASELTNKIYHIPKVLYHWRSIPNSTATNTKSKDYTHVAGIKALEDAIERRGGNAFVESIEDHSNIYLTRYLPVGNPKVSIIIPTRNMVSVLQKCLESIFKKTSYENFEIIIVDNNSDDPATFEAYHYWEEREKSRIKVFSLNIPFNYSKLNNFGVTKAEGELLLLLNNDIEVISENWLTEMVGQAIRSEIGAVGACLYYPDGSLQHGGVVLGLGGVAGHSHKHFSAESPGYFRRLKVVSNYTAVTAACLMIRKEIFIEVGGFEEELQVAFNDVDFCLKVWSEGYNNVWLPQVKLYHHESKSRGYEDTPEKQERFKKEIEWIKRRWERVLNNDPAYNPNLTKDREDFSLEESSISYENNIGINRS
ncbi:glycosyltransferase family 2 protein [Paenibacillus sp. FSL K6-2524]|uniref:glycosyltransferase family 2 protein n=1 Tax=Paenibacillus sp. FSL K6-2524 TaxID=2954516 RepID=UPI0030F4E4E3